MFLLVFMLGRLGLVALPGIANILHMPARAPGANRF